MKVFKMWVEEGEKIVILEDIDGDMSGEDFKDKMLSEFSGDELNLICELYFEGEKLEEEDYLKNWETIEVTMKYEDYINELKVWCKECMEECEE